MREGAEYLRSAEEFDSEAIDGAGGEGVRGGVAVAGENDAVEVGVLVLDGFDGAPEDSLAAAAVVGVGVKECDGALAVVSGGEDLEGDSED